MSDLVIRSAAVQPSIDNQQTFVWQLPADLFCFTDDLCKVARDLRDITRPERCIVQLPDIDQFSRWTELFPEAQLTLATSPPLPRSIAYGMCCIDKRLAHIGVENGFGHITYPGGVLLFDQVDMPYHSRLLDALVNTCVRTGSQLRQLDHHVGVDGGDGCAMFAHLPKVLRQRYHNLDAICKMLQRVRDYLCGYAIIASDCRLTITTIDRNHQRQEYDIDQPTAFDELQQHSICL